ncbi:MAG TPA: hypothetical protein VGX76_25340 [Pirellulales bacterium]|nr:hypothetical protein [Pirellulales bacterium]
MSRFPNRLVVAFMLGTYALAAIGGEALHALSDCGQHRANVHAMGHQDGKGDLRLAGIPGVQAGIPSVRAGDGLRHDEASCPICQYRAQGQLVIHCDNGHSTPLVELRYLREATNLPAAAVHHPYCPRAPPALA